MDYVLAIHTGLNSKGGKRVDSCLFHADDRFCHFTSQESSLATDISLGA